MGGLLLCAAALGRAHWSCINGRVVVEQGGVVGVDLAQVMAAAAASSKRIQGQALVWSCHHNLKKQATPVLGCAPH